MDNLKNEEGLFSTLMAAVKMGRGYPRCKKGGAEVKLQSESTALGRPTRGRTGFGCLSAQILPHCRVGVAAAAEDVGFAIWEGFAVVRVNIRA